LGQGHGELAFFDGFLRMIARIERKTTELVVDHPFMLGQPDHIQQ